MKFKYPDLGGGVTRSFYMFMPWKKRSFKWNRLQLISSCLRRYFPPSYYWYPIIIIKSMYFTYKTYRLLLHYKDFLLVLPNYEGKTCNRNLLILRHGVFSLMEILLWNFQFWKDRWSTHSQTNECSLAESCVTWLYLTMFYINCMEAVNSCLNIGIQVVVTNLEGQDLSWYDKPPDKSAFSIHL